MNRCAMRKRDTRRNHCVWTAKCDKMKRRDSHKRGKERPNERDTAYQSFCHIRTPFWSLHCTLFTLSFTYKKSNENTKIRVCTYTETYLQSKTKRTFMFTQCLTARCLIERGSINECIRAYRFFTWALALYLSTSSVHACTALIHTYIHVPYHKSVSYRIVSVCCCCIHGGQTDGRTNTSTHWACSGIL